VEYVSRSSPFKSAFDFYIPEVYLAFRMNVRGVPISSPHDATFSVSYGQNQTPMIGGSGVVNDPELPIDSVKKMPTSRGHLTAGMTRCTDQ
jgi:hypothetical protein